MPRGPAAGFAAPRRALYLLVDAAERVNGAIPIDDVVAARRAMVSVWDRRTTECHSVSGIADDARMPIKLQAKLAFHGGCGIICIGCSTTGGCAFIEFEMSSPIQSQESPLVLTVFVTVQRFSRASLSEGN